MYIYNNVATDNSNIVHGQVEEGKNVKDTAEIVKHGILGMKNMFYASVFYLCISQPIDQGRVVAPIACQDDNLLDDINALCRIYEDDFKIFGYQFQFQKLKSNI